MFPKSLNNRGIVLPLVFVFVIVLAVMVATYLYMVSFQTKNIGYQQQDVRALSIAEAGQEKAIWYLRNTAPDASTDGSWRVALPGRTETPVGWTGSYTMVVDDWNLAYSGNPVPFNSTATQRSSQLGPNGPARAIDGRPGIAGGNNTFWESQPGGPFTTQWIQIDFPPNSNFTINEARFRVVGAPGITRRPQNYQWDVSTDGSTWTTSTSVLGNGLADRTDVFPVPQNNVNFVRLTVDTITGGNRVRVSEIEVHWIRIKSSCVLDKSSKYVRQCILVTPLAGPNTITKIPNTWKEIDAATFNNPNQF